MPKITFEHQSNVPIEESADHASMQAWKDGNRNHGGNTRTRLVMADQIDQKILKLKFENFLTSSQIGAILHLSASSVRCRIHRLKSRQS